MESPIHSTKNPIVRRFRRAGEAAEFSVAEGLRLVREALDADQGIVEVAWSPRLRTRDGGEAVLARLRAKCPEVYEVSDRVLERLSSVQTHQGVSAIVRRPHWSPDDLFGKGRADRAAPLIVVAAGIRDPGNLGALMRSAEAAAATGLLVIAGSADPYRDKALRGSAGSAFRLPCVTLEVAAAVDLLCGRGVQILVAERAGAISCWDVDWTRPSAVVLGAEGHGIPSPLTAAATNSVVIPLADPVESLNVAVAAGVLLFEARRQRR